MPFRFITIEMSQQKWKGYLLDIIFYRCWSVAASLSLSLSVSSHAHRICHRFYGLFTQNNEREACARARVHAQFQARCKSTEKRKWYYSRSVRRVIISVYLNQILSLTMDVT